MKTDKNETLSSGFFESASFDTEQNKELKKGDGTLDDKKGKSGLIKPINSLNAHGTSSEVEVKELKKSDNTGRTENSEN